MGKTSSFRRYRLFMMAVGAVLLLGFSSLALAIPIYGNNGTSDLGSFQGTLSYSASSATDATLTLSLTNTSPSANGGFITAFLLNNPDDSIDSIDGTNFSNSNFGLLGLTDNGLSGGPNGQFDFGAALGGSYQGGGSPGSGIGVGDNATFEFNFGGSNLDDLSALSFVDELSTGNAAGQGHEWLVVRFKGFEGGGSDKVPGVRGDPDNPPTTAVPGPSTAGLLLLGLALLGIGTLVHYRRDKCRKN